ncbi:MAG TPA: methyltransferase domain-containing protein [Stellaceae bacterium]|nr:methyltransferase domain-containing protein [Stellaceae bacterium]
MSETGPGPQTSANAAMRQYWNEVAGPRWVRRSAAQEARNIEVATLLLKAAAAQPGERVLDVGCGTGATLLPFAEAVGPKGHATGVDISEPMLAVARQRVAERGLGNITLLLADAQVHAFAPASVDLLTSRFGVMFFADPTAAFRNLYAAVRPGGRLAMAVWASLADNAHMRIPYEIAVRRVGPPAPMPPHAPGPLAYSDHDYLRGILTAAGFAGVAIVPSAFHMIGITAASVAEQSGAMGPSGRLLDEKHADEATRQAVVAEAAAAFAAYGTANGEVRLPGTFLLVTARRPA